MTNQVQVIGLLRAPEYHRAKGILHTLHNRLNITLTPLLATDWESASLQLIQQHNLAISNPSVMVFIDNRYLGDESTLVQWVFSHYKISEPEGPFYYQQVAKEEYVNFIRNSQNRYVIWGITLGDGPEREIVIEIDWQSCPKTAKNFWEICMEQGPLTYRNTQIHRIVSEGYLEGGLYFENASPQQNTSIYGQPFPDETYAYKHDKPGIIGISKSRAHQNGCAFYITLRPLPHLNRRNVAFGRIVVGMTVFRDIAQLETVNQRPTTSCIITRIEPYADFLDKEFRPRSNKEKVQSKLESADIETLMKRRAAIVAEIESTRAELQQQVAFRSVISDMLGTLMAHQQLI